MIADKAIAKNKYKYLRFIARLYRLGISII